MQVQVFPVYDDRNSPVAGRGIALDITERKQARLKLERMNHLINQSTDEIYIHDLDEGQFIYANDSACDELGYSRDELLSLNVSDIETMLEPDTDLRKTIRGFMDRDEQFIRGTHVRKDGTEYPVEVSVQLYEYEGREYAIIVARNISQRVHRERKLERLNQLINQSTDEIIILEGQSGRVVQVNDAVTEKLGYSRDELRGMNVREIQTRFQNDEEEREEIFRRLKRKGQIFERGCHVRKDGTAFPVEVNLQFFSENGQSYFLAIARDITDRLRRERELQSYTEELEKANEDLRQFAYATSHDLKSPLRNISSYLQLIEREVGDSLGDQGAEYLDFARKGAHRMKRIIDGLLSFAELGRDNEAYDEVSIRGVIDEVRENLRRTIRDLDATIEVEELPTIEGNRSQLIQLFQNLIENALKFQDHSSPKISIQYENVDEGYQISIKDNGIGIKKRYQEQIFEIFNQLDSDRGGTGVGLALCRRIVEVHNGFIEVESERGEGSTFIMTLPESQSDFDESISTSYGGE